jgi:hypothetical protein
MESQGATRQLLGEVGMGRELQRWLSNSYRKRTQRADIYAHSLRRVEHMRPEREESISSSQGVDRPNGEMGLMLGEMSQCRLGITSSARKNL